MQTISTYRAQARQSLQGRWGDSVVAVLLVSIVGALCNTPSIPDTLLTFPGLNSLYTATSTWWSKSLSGFSYVLVFLVVSPLSYALQGAFLRMIRGDERRIWSNTWSNFKSRYLSYLPAGVLVSLLCALLGVVTLGIGLFVLSYAYSMVPFLLHDYPNLTTKEALKISREMMKGHKWDRFVLDLSFMGWVLLCILTLGIGLLWLAPYMQASYAHFYEDLKTEKIVDEDDDQTIEEVEAEEA